MNALPPLAPAQQAEPPVRTLADVIVRLNANDHIDDVRRRDLISAVRRVAKWLDRPVDQVPVNIRSLARALDALHPRTIGVSAKTFANARSGLATALRVSRDGLPKQRRLSPDWRALRDALPKSGGLRAQLSRLIGYCSDQGLSPTSVDDAVVARFQSHLAQSIGVADPARRLRQTVASWNKAAREIDGWPATQLTLPLHRKPRFRVRPEELTPSLAADLEAYIGWQSGTDPLDDSTPTRPWKPNTIRRVRSDLETMLAGYRARGHDLYTFRSLADVVRPEVVKEMLRHRLDQSDGRPTTTTRQWMVTLIAIARHWVKADAATLADLRRMQRKLGGQPGGLTAKNRRALSQFDDPANVRALLALPEALMVEADRMLQQGHDRCRAARLAQKALAVALLLSQPMRIGNLAALVWHRHLIEPAGRIGPLLIDVPGETTKTGEPVLAQLPSWSATLVRHYVHKHLPALSTARGVRALFPGDGGAPKSANLLGAQITQVIRKRLGLTLTAHQFRHLAAKLVLDHDPGAFEAVRQLLGHRNLKTTTAAYAGLDTARAAKFYDRILAEARLGGTDHAA